jgi:4-hydroxybenzoate polyprenyltransferase
MIPGAGGRARRWLGGWDHVVMTDQPDLSAPSGGSTPIPLVIDADRALLRSDPAFEGLVRFVRDDPAAALRAVSRTARLRAAPDKLEVAALPVREDVVAWLEARHAAGRPIGLVSETHALAEPLAARFPFVDDVVVVESDRDAPATRADVLRRRYPEGFIYAGGSAADLDVWRHAAGIVLVDAPRAVERRASAIHAPLAVFKSPPAGFTIWRRALRLHQWAKNALIFIPLLLGGKFHDPAAWGAALLGFVALGVLASSAYLINDVWDLADDRRHWSKRGRPIAAGMISIPRALAVALLGLIASFALISGSGPMAIAVLGLYLALSTAYLLRLKREPIVDALALASLFTLRLGLGVAVTHVRFSPWLFVFSMFVFLSLSLAKRCTEISRAAAHGRERILGRGYRPSDEPLVLAMGVAAMFGATLIMVIYLISDAFPAGYYAHPVFLWVFPVVLFMWLARVWLLCHRGALQDDPVVFALKDGLSVAYGAVMAIAFVAAVL